MHQMSNQKSLLGTSAALVGVLFCSYLTNRYALTTIDAVTLLERNTISILTASFLMLIALVSSCRPKLFTFSNLACALITFMAFGVGFSAWGISFNERIVSLAGIILSQWAWQVSIIIVGISCLNMKTRQMILCVVWAFVIGAFLRQLFILWLPEHVGLILYIAIPLLAISLIGRQGNAYLGEFSRGESYVQASTTNPFSFLPFGHQLFICLLLFRIAPGYALYVDGGSGVSQSAPWALLVFAGILIAVILKLSLSNIDNLFTVAALLIIAGFLLLPLTDLWTRKAVLNLLVAGAGVFEIFTWIVLLKLARETKAASVATFAWGFFMTQLGTTVGQALAYLTDMYAGNHNNLVVITTCLVLIFIVYFFVILKGFSFSASINSIVPFREMSVTKSLDTVKRYIMEKCKLMGAQYGLTDREQEVLVFLALGHNARYIQNELTVSYNTVRTHVKHIYQKLDVHSQQELMHTVEEFDD